MTTLRVESITAGYGHHPVLHDAAVTVPSGHLVALLGPSGCGKSTLLRAVAGLHRPTGGRIWLDDTEIDGPATHLPTHRRRVTLVPQDAALFPHLDVAANVAFGIRGQRDSVQRTDHLLELVGLAGLGARQVHQLSGGQQQRVALARALAPRPAVVLLDEPFSSLDARLRDQLRDDVRSLLTAESATALLVTHDQQEALSVADEIAVMREGRVLQQTDPATLYRSPEHSWTAAFIGDSTLLPANVDGSTAHTALGDIAVAGGDGTTVLMRPEDLGFSDRGTPARVTRRTYRGHDWLVALVVDDLPVLVRCTDQIPRIGEIVQVVPLAPGRLVR